MSQLKIHHTNNIEQFHLHEMNRKVNPNHVKDLAASMRKNGIRHPIIVDSSMAIIDGQHRWHAAQLLFDQEGIRIKIPFIVKRMSADLIAEINTLQLKWTITNWIEFHHKKGNENYTKLLEARTQFPGIKMSALAPFLHAGPSFLITKALREGDFVYELTDEKEYILSQIVEMSQFKPAVKQKAFLIAIMWLQRCPEFRSERLFDKLRANLGSIIQQSGTGNWAKHLIYWYNKGLRNGRLNADDLPSHH